MDPLRTCLLDLLYELREANAPLTVGGGFGLVLKRQYLATQKVPTLFSELPEPRATNDIDLFLRAELFADLERTREIANALRRLGFRPIKKVEYLQWIRTFPVGQIEQSVKIDLLIGPLGDLRNHFVVHGPRVRPKGERLGLHAFLTNEALHIDEAPLKIELQGNRSTGVPHAATVFIPETFSYLLMKLSAFADRKEDENKDLGRHHAMDAYTIVGMMTEAEYERAQTFATRCREDPHFNRVRRVVAEEFSKRDGQGMLRLREHQLFRSNFRLDDFSNVLTEIFSP